MNRMKWAAVAAASVLVAGGVVAHEGDDRAASIERRLERIEKAIERLESRWGGRDGQAMGGGCPMMGGGMMGGGTPNEQWRGKEQPR